MSIDGDPPPCADTAPIFNNAMSMEQLRVHLEKDVDGTVDNIPQLRSANPTIDTTTTSTVPIRTENGTDDEKFSADEGVSERLILLEKLAEAQRQQILKLQRQVRSVGIESAEYC